MKNNIFLRKSSLYLNKIAASNLEGVIAGKSFYSGNIEIKKAIKILENNAQN